MSRRSAIPVQRVPGGREVVAAATQDRIFAEEPTEGYNLLKLLPRIRSRRAGRHTITARLDNVTNELYRNHLSLIKDLVPEMGRNFKVLYNVRF